MSLLTHPHGGGALIERDRDPVVPAGRQPITITLNLENFQTSLLRFWSLIIILNAPMWPWLAVVRAAGLKFHWTSIIMSENLSLFYWCVHSWECMFGLLTCFMWNLILCLKLSISRHFISYLDCDQIWNLLNSYVWKIIMMNIFGSNHFSWTIKSLHCD